MPKAKKDKQIVMELHLLKLMIKLPKSTKLGLEWVRGNPL
jgi:hypothetical protein